MQIIKITKNEWHLDEATRVIQQETSRRLDLDENKFDLDREEQKQAIVERDQALTKWKKKIDITELLDKKLQ